MDIVGHVAAVASRPLGEPPLFVLREPYRDGHVELRSETYLHSESTTGAGSPPPRGVDQGMTSFLDHLESATIAIFFSISMPGKLRKHGLLLRVLLRVRCCSESAAWP
jgi:hypothetical protein